MFITVQNNLFAETTAYYSNQSRTDPNPTFLNNNYLKKNNSILIAGTQSNNFSAIKFYLALGFKEISVRKNYYTKNSNEPS